jgi:2,3-bisphosphoglycerate-dependent phosphoglycerate mutase
MAAVELLLIRHCQAEGQAPDASLTAEGRAQAERLAAGLAGAGICRIVSSPFRRARQSIEPLARRLGLEVGLDDRLAERVLCGSPAADWEEMLRLSFEDLDLCFEGGESSAAAVARGREAVADLLSEADGPVAAVSHGNLMTLILRQFDGRFGFKQWRALTNPDVFRVSGPAGKMWVQRVWE